VYKEINFISVYKERYSITEYKKYFISVFKKYILYQEINFISGKKYILYFIGLQTKIIFISARNLST